MLEPEQAANRAEDTTFVWISPPGRNHIQREMAEYIRSPMPERFISSPIRMKSGTATRTKLVFTSQALADMMFHNGRRRRRTSL